MSHTQKTKDTKAHYMLVQYTVDIYNVLILYDY